MRTSIWPVSGEEQLEDKGLNPRGNRDWSGHRALVPEVVENGNILNLFFCFTNLTAHLLPRPDDLGDICWEVTCCLPGHLALEGFPENLGKAGGAERVTS